MRPVTVVLGYPTGMKGDFLMLMIPFTSKSGHGGP